MHLPPREERKMETLLSAVAFAISVLSGGFALYTFYWTANRDRKQATPYDDRPW